MINFRYHIVSLMAVFLALSVGIVVGVSLRPSIDEGLAQQAAQDRKTVQDLRAEIGRLNTLDNYRDAYAEQVGPAVTAGVLSTYRVTLVVMPDAPEAVVRSITDAVDEAGGQVTSVATISPDVFDEALVDRVNGALSTFTSELGLTDAMGPAMRVGLALGRTVTTSTSGDVDPLGEELTRTLNAAGLVRVQRTNEELAQLVIVVSAAAETAQAGAGDRTGQVEFAAALDRQAAGVVVAGPNSEGLPGSDVAAIRGNAAGQVLSTVDVADLPSGVATVILAGKEQVLGRHGHYGALAGADAPVPELPVR